MRALPGVESAAYGSMLPFLSIGQHDLALASKGVPPDPDDPGDTLFRVGTSDYLSTLGVTLREGRLLDARDGREAPLSIVVNETLARKYWSGAAGDRTSPVRLGDPTGPFYTIVGVVKDVRERGHSWP